jgi:hypothetical protein
MLEALLDVPDPNSPMHASHLASRIVTEVIRLACGAEFAKNEATACNCALLDIWSQLTLPPESGARGQLVWTDIKSHGPRSQGPMVGWARSVNWYVFSRSRHILDLQRQSSTTEFHVLGFFISTSRA